MTAKKTDNRARPKIHRTDDAHDGILRTYATEHDIEPWQALELAIRRLAGIESLELSRLAADLESARGALIDANAERNTFERAAKRCAEEAESAREATRRADAEVERLTRELAASTEAARVANVDRARAEQATADERATSIKLDLDWQEASGAASPEELTAALETHRARRAEAAPCACALPDDLAPRLATIAARRGVDPDVMLANVIKNGISKIQASDEYQDRQKAARKART